MQCRESGSSSRHLLQHIHDGFWTPWISPWFYNLIKVIKYFLLGKTIATEIGIRYALCAGANTLGLSLEVQALPAHANTLNSHPSLCQALTPATLLKAFNISSNFFREAWLIGPKPTIFVNGNPEIFADSLSSDHSAFCSGSA